MVGTCTLILIISRCPTPANSALATLSVQSNRYLSKFLYRSLTRQSFKKYFSWGDTIGKNKNGSGSYSFSQANYNAGKCGSGHKLTGYFIPGNATYDAARANMGYPWKMPTQEQGQELIDGTTSTYITLNGVNGRKFTSKTNSTKYIFLPLARCWYNTSFINPSYGQYWLSTCYDSSKAYFLTVSSSMSPAITVTDRYQGFSVRAIQ